MEIKKNPKFDLGKSSLIFFQIGMILMLFITWQALEWKSTVGVFESSSQLEISKNLEEIIPITEQLNIPPPPPPPPPIVHSVIIEVEDEADIEESVIQSTETNQNQEILEILKIEEIAEAEVEEEEIADVPFAVIENVPIYPGCEVMEGNEARKKCLSNKVEQYVASAFNTNLADELGLEGKQRIYVKFTINKNGDIVDVQARAPHPKLEAEAVKVVRGLPKMVPGKQRGVPVGVSYSLPIIFQIEI
ncbi:energy transducer TonB [Ulvibacter antarcticus]|uniref:Outer membrane transport energization protein TonB n=1 Tax=Ulvibacter antarcticus TaxID=442714 RepID=A0A3L9YYE9_9FLAO|nr:energy transducer TonB [Ulvibacter antarcticus]RMA65686.1 outer membrane transport energization protein TonB [Ulvibacter antarcticus]